MLDAKNEAVRIIQMIFLVQLKSYQLKRELREFDGGRDVILLRNLYAELVRLCQRILIKVFQLQADEKCLNRPFIFKDCRYDECDGHLYRQMKKFRAKIIEKDPASVNSEELAYALLSTGRVAKVKDVETF